MTAIGLASTEPQRASVLVFSSAAFRVRAAGRSILTSHKREQGRFATVDNFLLSGDRPVFQDEAGNTTEFARVVCY
jgi:hypothetical protein